MHRRSFICLNLILCLGGAGLGQTTVDTEIQADTTWTQAQSPVLVTGSAAVAPGVRLTIAEGVTVLFPEGYQFSVAGTLNALGTAVAPVVFTRAGPTGTWGRVLLSGEQEHQFRHVRFEHTLPPGGSAGAITAFNTRVRIEHVTFTNTVSMLVRLNNTSCVIRHCLFPSIQNSELLDFNGMPPGGHALIEHNVFGTTLPVTTGYNDVVDFTGGNRPGPIVQLRDNIFLAGVDDCFDMDGTDAHIEGNVFVNVRKDTARESSSNPITTGANGTNTSQLVICRNLFYDTEHAVLVKDSGTVVMQNNTLARIRPNPLSTNQSGTVTILAEAPGIAMFGEPWRAEVGSGFGSGLVFEGNIAADLEVTDPWPLLGPSGAFLVVRNSLVEGFPQTGTGNRHGSPRFVDTDGITAFNIREKLGLRPDSPARHAGPNGLDMGALVPAGASLRGAPTFPTASRQATVTIAGPGIWSYRWRLNGAPWSAEIPLVPEAIRNGAPFTADMFDGASPLVLTNLSLGVQNLEVQGRNSAGVWQEAPFATATWTVLGDSDGDGLPDTWEIENGLDPQLAADGSEDLDADGHDNRAEYAAGTDPRLGMSVLRLKAEIMDGLPSLSFAVSAGRSYRLEHRVGSPEGAWSPLAAFAPALTNGWQTAVDPDTPAAEIRFYRLVTPAP